MRLLLIAVLGLQISCAGRQQTNAETTARVAMLEEKLTRMEERLAVAETATAKIDAVVEGVNALLGQLEGARTGGRKEPDPAETYSMPIDGNFFIGPKHAKVTMVKGFDFYCGYCDKVRPVLTQLRKEYGNDLKIVFKHFVIHDEIARLPALAACAAQNQGKFMPMFDAIWEEGIRSRQQLTEEMLVEIARTIGLKLERFKKDLAGKACAKQVRRDFRQLSIVGARGTPAFYINGRFIAGALPIDQYRAIIDEELERADKALAGGVKLEDYYAGLVEKGRKSL
jgi:protein-disulfide isomerase